MNENEREKAMKKASTALMLAALCALAAACHDPKPSSSNYGATIQDANKAQQNLNNASGL